MCKSLTNSDRTKTTYFTILQKQTCLKLILWLKLANKKAITLLFKLDGQVYY